jgi:hypothetical protein
MTVEFRTGSEIPQEIMLLVKHDMEVMQRRVIGPELA